MRFFPLTISRLFAAVWIAGLVLLFTPGQAMAHSAWTISTLNPLSIADIATGGSPASVTLDPKGLFSPGSQHINPSSIADIATGGSPAHSAWSEKVYSHRAVSILNPLSIADIATGASPAHSAEHSVAVEKLSPFEDNPGARPHCALHKHAHLTGLCPHLQMQMLNLQAQFLLGPDCGGLPSDRFPASTSVEKNPSLAESFSPLDRNDEFVLLSAFTPNDGTLGFEPDIPPPQILS